MRNNMTCSTECKYITAASNTVYTINLHTGDNHNNNNRTYFGYLPINRVLLGDVVQLRFVKQLLICGFPNNRTAQILLIDFYQILLYVSAVCYSHHQVVCVLVCMSE